MNTYKKVEDILRRYPQAKDNDNILVALYWWEELENNPHQIDREKFKYFLQYFREGNVTMPETITRARRKLQNDKKTLRGDKYNARHAKAKSIRDNYQIYFDDMFGDIGKDLKQLSIYNEKY